MVIDYVESRFRVSKKIFDRHRRYLSDPWLTFTSATSLVPRFACLVLEAKVSFSLRSFLEVLTNGATGEGQGSCSRGRGCR